MKYEIDNPHVSEFTCNEAAEAYNAVRGYQYSVWEPAKRSGDDLCFPCRDSDNGTVNIETVSLSKLCEKLDIRSCFWAKDECGDDVILCVHE